MDLDAGGEVGEGPVGAFLIAASDRRLRRLSCRMLDSYAPRPVCQSGCCSSGDEPLCFGVPYDWPAARRPATCWR